MTDKTRLKALAASYGYLKQHGSTDARLHHGAAAWADGIPRGLGLRAALCRAVIHSLSAVEYGSPACGHPRAGANDGAIRRSGSGRPGDVRASVRVVPERGRPGAQLRRFPGCRVALDADHRKNENGRGPLVRTGLGLGRSQPTFNRKPNDLAHDAPPGWHDKSGCGRSKAQPRRFACVLDHTLKHSFVVRAGQKVQRGERGAAAVHPNKQGPG